MDLCNVLAGIVCRGFGYDAAFYYGTSTMNNICYKYIRLDSEVHELSFVPSF